MNPETKVAVVTGAGRGLGRAIALAFAKKRYRVVLAARSQEAIEEVARAVRELGGEALPVATDVTIPASVEQMASTVLAQYGTVDILVNNSGIAGPTLPLVELSLDEWEETMAVNVRGIYLTCHFLLPAMIRAGSGRVINIGSMTGKRPLLNRTPYAASKMAVLGLTRTLALELGQSNITVNCVSPGPVEGERIEQVVAAQAQSQAISIEEARADFVKASPLGRMVTAEDVAETVLFLSSGRAANITGEDINVSAGICMY